MLDSELERRLREIDEEIRRLEEKYGMSYKEFYNHVEGNMNVLLERFDADEVMDDLAKLIDLLDEKEKILRKMGKDVNLFSELDEGWVRVFP
jgi:translation initiation factor 2 alpha subunit (eIF-2alpha)